MDKGDKSTVHASFQRLSAKFAMTFVRIDQDHL